MGVPHSAGRRGAPSRSLKPATARCPCPGRPVDYALEQDNVWAISLQQLLAWMQNPIPASEITPEKLGCGNPGGAAPAPTAGTAALARTTARAPVPMTRTAAPVPMTRTARPAPTTSATAAPAPMTSTAAPALPDGIVDGSTRRFEKDWAVTACDLGSACGSTTAPRGAFHPYPSSFIPHCPTSSYLCSTSPACALPLHMQTMLS